MKLVLIFSVFVIFAFAKGDSQGARLVKAGHLLNNLADAHESPVKGFNYTEGISNRSSIRAKLRRIGLEKEKKYQQRKQSIKSGIATLKNLLHSTKGVELNRAGFIIKVDPKAIGRVVHSMKRRTGVTMDSQETRNVAMASGFNQYQYTGHDTCDALNIMMRIHQFERNRSVNRSKRMALLPKEDTANQSGDDPNFFMLFPDMPEYLQLLEQFMNVDGGTLNESDLTFLANHMVHEECTYYQCAYSGDETKTCDADYQSLVSMDPQVSVWIQFMIGKKVDPSADKTEAMVYRLADLIHDRMRNSGYATKPPFPSFGILTYFVLLLH